MSENTIPQHFEAFPHLSEHLKRMASTGQVGGGSDWSAFVRELNRICSLASSQPSPGLRPIPSVGDFKRLCWIAWRHGSIGSGSSIREDQEGFRDWWENDAEFLLHHLPVEPKPDFDEKAEEQQPIEGEQKTIDDGKTYIKIPVEVRAIQWKGDNRTEIELFVGQRLKCSIVPREVEREVENITHDAYTIEIPTREGAQTAIRMDWIIEGDSDEHGKHYWVNKPDYFRKAYERVQSSSELEAQPIVDKEVPEEIREWINDRLEMHFDGVDPEVAAEEMTIAMYHRMKEIVAMHMEVIAAAVSTTDALRADFAIAHNRISADGIQIAALLAALKERGEKYLEAVGDRDHYQTALKKRIANQPTNKD